MWRAAWTSANPPRNWFSSFRFGLDLIFLTPPDWTFSRAELDNEFFSANIFFLSEEVLVGEIMDISFMVELDRIFGVDISFEAERSLGEDDF